MKTGGKGKTGVLSAVYPGAQAYIPQFLSSLERQTDKDFTLFLVNDGLPDVQSLTEKYDLSVNLLEQSGPASELRKKGIKWAAAQSEALVFMDADDYCAENRVEVCKGALGDCDIVCNELFLFGEGLRGQEPMLGRFFKEGAQVTAQDIVCSNCLGLTNTAMRVSAIAKDFEAIPDGITAFDWAFFALAVNSGARTVFTSRTQTYYRQHDYNSASPICFTDDQIMRGVSVKRDHYQWLSVFYKEYASMAEAFKDLSVRLAQDEILRKKYCGAVRQKASGIALWWEPVKLLKELGL